MRSILLLASTLLASTALCQSPDGTRPFASIKSDVSIVVRKHETGANILEATVLNPDYPADLLKSQMQAIGHYTGAQLNGLQVFKSQIDPENKSLTFLKATCGTFGIYDPAKGGPNLEPLIKAFVGAPEPYTIKGMSVIFEGVTPGATTIRKLENDSVSLEATESAQPVGIEYRIGLKIQDPTKIVIPTGPPEPSNPQEPSPSREGPPIFVWAAIGLAGLATGVLVYLFLLKGRRSSA